MFRPRNAVHVPQPDLRVSVLGCECALPFVLAPVGFSRLLHAQGEPAVEAAAGEAGIGFCMSSFSGYACETVAARAKAPLWYQLYLAGGREVTEAALARVWQAGFQGLGRDHRYERARQPRARPAQRCTRPDERSLPPHAPVSPCRAAQAALDGVPRGSRRAVLPEHPAARSRRVSSGGRARDAHGRGGDVGGFHLDPPGVAGPDPRQRRAHRGRHASCLRYRLRGRHRLQSRRPPARYLCSAARALPEVVRAANGQGPVLVDGGIRRGGDILKALCMGANACLVGRAYAYGLMAAGGMGVARAIAMLKADLERTMALLGCGSIRELDGSLVDVPKA